MSWKYPQNMSATKFCITLVLPVRTVHSGLVDDTLLNGGERYEVGLVIVFLQFFCISSVGTVEVGKVVGTG